MGKKGRKKISLNKTFVSVCTPTYNRKKFIPYLIKSFEDPFNLHSIRSCVIETLYFEKLRKSFLFVFILIVGF